MGAVDGPLIVTGASGFIGRYTVAHARAAGRPVKALVRRAEAVPKEWRADEGIDIGVVDLAAHADLASLFKGAGTVIHTAGTFGGDHTRDTLDASRKVIAAVVAAGVPHVVLAGSIAVYDFATLADHDVVSEFTAVNGEGRDAYVAAKVAQEVLFAQAAGEHGFSLSILRFGAVWGPTRLFNAHIGPSIGPILAMIDSGGRVPIAHVDLAAECLLQAARNPMGIETLNIVDDALPGRDRFLKAFRACGWPKLALHIPLGMMRFLASVTPNGPKMPGLLRSATLEARHKPLHYPNAAMHKRLKPVTMLPFEEAMSQAIEIEQGLTL